MNKHIKFSLQLTVIIQLIGSLLLIPGVAFAATAINVGDPVSAEITVIGEVDDYTFSVNAGDNVYFDAQNGDGGGGLLWTLTAPSGAIIFDGAFIQPQGAEQLSEGGQYTLSFSDSLNRANIAYEFQLFAVADPVAIPISIDQRVLGEITTPGSIVQYSFTGVADARVYFRSEIELAYRDLLWRLINPDGSVSFDGGFRAADEPNILPQSGEYLLEVYGYKAAFGGFVFQIFSVPDTPVILIEQNQQVKVHFDVPGVKAIYEFDATMGQNLYIDRLEGGINLGFNWELFDPNGVSVARTSIGRLNDLGPFIAGATGRYQLHINGRLAHTGLMAFQVVEVPASVAAQSIVLDEFVHGIIDVPGKSHDYVFNASDGDSLKLYLLRGGISFRLRLTAPDGSIVFQNASGGRAFNLTQDGEYTLHVATHEGAISPYLFVISSSITSPPYPPTADLITTSVQAPLKVIGNPASIDVSWTVSNQGSVAASGWTDTIVLTQGGGELGAISSIGKQRLVLDYIAQTGSLAPGASYTRTANVQLPDNFEASFEVTIEADGMNQVLEQDKANNVTGAGSMTWVQRRMRQLSGEVSIQLDQNEGQHYPQGTDLSLSGQIDLFPGAVNALFIMDMSGSTRGDYTGPDRPVAINNLDANADGQVNIFDNLNADAFVGDILDAEIGALLKLVSKLQTKTEDLNIATLLFADKSWPADAGVDSFSQAFVDPQDNQSIGQRVADFDESIRSAHVVNGFLTGTELFNRVWIHNGTNFQAPVQRAAELIDKGPKADRTLVFMLTDGESVGALHTQADIEALTETDISFFAYQIGSGSVTSELQRLADGIDATPGSSAVVYAIADPNELAAVLSSAIELAGVAINGRGVQSLDASGHFFNPATIVAGPNEFMIEAIDSNGRNTSRTFTLYGDVSTGNSGISRDLTGASEARFSRTRYNRRSKQLLSDVALSNTGEYPLTGPFSATVRPIIPALVSLANPSGLDAQSVPLIEFELPNGDTDLALAGQSMAFAAQFDNPAEQRFSVQLNPLGSANNAPQITSTPPVSVMDSAPYHYAVLATDMDGHTLGYALTQAPASMSINPLTGEIDWLATPVQIGVHQITVSVDDGFGASATQSYQLSVLDSLINYLPLFQSVPVTSIDSGDDYVYIPQVFDPNGDSLNFSLNTASAGFSINTLTGAIQSTAPADGAYDLEIIADDARGGIASQGFRLTVGGVAGNAGVPVISSTPGTGASPGKLYLYQPLASDPDGDALSYSLLAAPVGMQIDPLNGRVTWTPDSSHLGPNIVALRVDDGSGNYATQFFTIEVSDTRKNLPPAIVSVPAYYAGEDELYTYQLLATDPEGDALTFMLIDGPTTMSIDAVSGLLSYMPAVATAGSSVTIGIQVEDSSSNIGEQAYILKILPENTAPVFVTMPVVQVSAGAVYRYAAKATDADDEIRYHLENGPSGLAIDAQSGLLTMQTNSAQIGDYAIIIRAIDARGLFVDQSYTLSIVADTVAPIVSILVQPSQIVTLNDNLVLQVKAVDDVDFLMASMTLDIEGVPIALDADGIGHYAAISPGLFNLHAMASDQSGNWGETYLSLRVVDPADQTPPEIIINSPAPGAILDRITDVIGSVTEDAQLEFYHLEYAVKEHIDMDDIAAPNPAWVRIAQADQQVNNDVLGRFDVSAVRNGDYLLRVIAQDTSGNIGIKVLPVGVVSGKLGRLTFEVTDIELPQTGPNIRVSRLYDSFDAANQGDFGQGWRLAFADPDIRETIAVHPGEIASSGLVVNPFVENTRVYLNNPEGKRVGFTFKTTVTSGLLGSIYHPGFESDPGVFDRLEVDDTGLRQHADGSFSYYLLGFSYNPSIFRLIRKDGTIYHYSQFSGLSRITDLNGNEVSFDENGIHNSNGGGVDFTRDALGRISRISDDAGGSIDYSYDVDGNLARVVDQVGKPTEYRYHDAPAHFLKEIEDSGGNVQTMEYDSSGRFSGFTDAAGHRSSQSWDSDNFSGTITDAQGNVTELIYDPQGNLLSSTDALGHVTQFTYNADNLRSSKTDALGNTMLYFYDTAGNNTRVVDPLGNETRSTFDALNNKNTQTNALGAVTETLFDSKGNLVQVTLPGGTSAAFSYDPQGRIISATDFRGSVTLYQYTGAQSLASQVTTPEGEISLYQYNQFGQITVYTNPLGETTRYTYDAVGAPAEITDALGNIQRYRFEDGVVISTDNPLSERVVWSYDENDRVSRMTQPMGGEVRFTYDALGNRTSLIDPAGNLSSYAYNALSQVETETDPSGNTRQYQYDSNNNLLHETDRNGRVREFTYDANNRLTVEKWLTAGVLVNQIDTSFDAIGRVLSVSDNHSALSFVYDAQNRIIQSDNMGTAGVPRRVLQYAYDGNGNVLQIIDDQGTQLDSIYDLNNQLLTRVLQSNETARIDIDYDANGQRSELDRSLNLAGSAALVNSIYQRDHLGRVTSLEHQNSNTLATISSFINQFDGASKLVSSDHHGQLFQYSYDMDAQLTGTTRSLFGNESFIYDVSGNRSNGGLSVIGNGNRLLSDADFSYQYDPEGNLIQRLNQLSGELARFNYDHMNHLLSAEIRDVANTLIGTYSYTYDSQGRRILRDENGTIKGRVYDGEQPWLEQTGSLGVHYLYSDNIDEILATIDSNGRHRTYLSDHQGTLFDLIDEFAGVVNHLDYDSFGLLRSQTDPLEAVDHLFTGRELDAGTGLYHYRSRAYDPAAGRFTSEDTIAFAGGDANLYRYVNNSPQNATDPNGESAVEYGELLCHVVTPLVGGVKTYADCLDLMYTGIALSIESLEGGAETATSFYGCIAAGLITGPGSEGAGKISGWGAEAGKFIQNPPKYLGDPMSYAALACNAGGF